VHLRPRPSPILIFRGLIIAEMVLFVLVIPLSLLQEFITQVMLGRSGLNAVLEVPEPTVMDAMLATGGLASFFVILAGLVISWIGLLRFWSWSRWLYLATVTLVYIFGFGL